MLRLFVALHPGEQVLERVGRMIESLRRKAPEARWARPEGMHLTLVFLGLMNDAFVPEIERALEEAAGRHPPVVLTVQGGGVFGSPKKPRVLWTGLSGELGPLRAVQRELETALIPFGIAPEDRAYSPHLTLARARNPRGDPALAACAAALAGQDFGQARIDEVLLYQSELSPSGVRYTVLARAALRGTAG